MEDQTKSFALEERRLALEEQKWKDEIALRKLELEAKARESDWTARLFSPLMTTLFAGILTVAGSVAATLLQGSNTLQLEREKFESTKKLEQDKFASSKTLEVQKEQHELILKMISVGNEEQARSNIQFLAQTGLIPDQTLAKRLLEAKATAVLPRSGVAANSNVSADTMSIGDSLKRVSVDALNMIIDFETGGRQSYDARFGHPTWPGLAAGITIGIGYDVGYAQRDAFRRDWQRFLSEADLDSLMSAVGIVGPAAEAFVNRLASVTIPWDVALAQFQAVTVPKWVTLLERDLPNTAVLPPDSYGALLSLAYNRGMSFKVQGDRFREMRIIADSIDNKKFSDIPDQIRSMKRLWGSLPAIQALRDREATLFERGFASQHQSSNP